MPDPNVRDIGMVEDIDGTPLEVGVDYDTVVIGSRRLTQAQAEEFGHLFVSACWQAARQVPGD